MNVCRTHQSSLSAPLFKLPPPRSLKAFVVQLLFLLVIVISLERVLQFGRDFLEEADLLTEVVLHLRAEVPYTRAVEVLDLCQRGAGNDVAAVVELAFLLWTVFHLGQCTWTKMGEGKRGRRLRKVWQVYRVELN